jgi:hypothetical protein
VDDEKRIFSGGGYPMSMSEREIYDRHWNVAG